MGWACFWKGHIFQRARGEYDSVCTRCGEVAPRYADLEGVTHWLVQGERKQQESWSDPFTYERLDGKQ